jgi:N-acetylglucosaminyldiphosphoundecaprenol N-acetyl-beta-D-mannosaminyltransferase
MSAAVTLMGVKLAALSEAQVVEQAASGLEEGRGGWICPVNLDVLHQLVGSAELRQLVGSADLLIADGMPLLWAARLQDTPLPERVAGSSLVVSLSGELARRGRSVYLLGGNEGTAASAGRWLQGVHGDLTVAGSCCPPFGFDRSPEQRARVIEEAVAAEPALVFVGLGFPKQERLIAELRQRLPATWFLSCGGTFSMLAGEAPRAHPLVQRLGLEWVHRLALEPRRLARRYLVEGIPFAARLGAASLLQRLRAGRSGGLAIQEQHSENR